MARKAHLAWILLAGLAMAETCAAQAPKLDPAGIEFFEAKIRPVLAAHCYECHSAKLKKDRGGLVLDSRMGLLQGGDTGPSIVPGHPERSLLVKALRHSDLKMPPKKRLPDGVVADFVRWIALGAPDPRDGAAGPGYKRLSLEEAKTFWSFQAPMKKEPPEVRNSGWAQGPIDRFVLAAMEKKGLEPVADADRATLLRRLHFDLIGLPPTPEEVDSFSKDASPGATEKVVDRLLASPHFGERWGRHWLDVARYAESNGNADNTPFPYAYRYRDWVIDALNRDMPYDRFVRAQVAGDLLPAAGPRERDEHLIATGFLALTSKPRAQNNPDYKFDLIADQIDVTSRAVLGLSVMCARCHDHKFDPISTKEYYGMAGFFDSTVMLFGAGGKGNNKKKGGGGLHLLSDGSYSMGVRDGKATDTRVCLGGESKKLGEMVPRGFLAAVDFGNPPPEIRRKTSGRLELAQWLTRPENPLTARVAVNRIWQHLFGQGLVTTSDNFGFLGEAPSHPELLDWLAVRFMEKGWSTKAMIREIVLSRTYRLAARHAAGQHRIDPDIVNLWRARTRRLNAESLRDAILAVSGRLDPRPLPGSALDPTMLKGMKKVPGTPREHQHRSVYLAMVRGAPLPELLSLFDAANPNLVVAQREVTTVPSQALFMMNSPFMVDQSRHFAGRLLARKDLNDPQRIDLAYRLALGRPATEGERERAATFLAEAASGGPQQAWAGFCQTLLASAEFRYLQ